MTAAERFVAASGRAERYAPVPMNEKKQAIRLERLLPALVLAGLRNAVTLFDTNVCHYHEPCPRKGEEKAFGITTDVMRR